MAMVTKKVEPKVKNFIKRFRKDAGKTPEQVAEYINMKLSYYLAVENGEFMPPADISFRIAQCFNTTIADLYGLPIARRVSADRAKEKGYA